MSTLQTQVGANTTAIAANTTGIATLQSGIASGTIGLVRQDPSSRAITIGAQTDGSVATFAGTAGDRRPSGVAAGTGLTDAVNVGQLNAAIGVVAGGTLNAALRANNTSNLAAPTAGGADALAGGFGASAGGAQSTAFGTSAQASGAQATAIGQGAQASFAGATALGAGAKAIAGPTTAVGFNATASANEASAFGAFATASGVNATALGRSAAASGAGATAVGFGATAGVNAVAIGHNASAAQDNATALGAGAATTRANQVAIGTAANTVTVAGVTSAASLAAQTGPTRFVTSDANGNLAASAFGPTDIGGVISRLDNLSQYTLETRREARSGAAMGIASAQVRYDDRPGKISMGTGLGHFKGETGLATGLGYTSPDQRWRANLSASSNLRSDWGVGAGFSVTLN